MTATDDRVTRAVPESEAFIIGAMMNSAYALDEALDELRPHHFHSPATEAVFELISQMVTDGDPVDPTTVLARATTNGIAKRLLDGGAVLADWSGLALNPAAIRPHIQAVRSSALRRALASSLVRGHQILQDSSLEAEHVAALLSDEFHAIATQDAPTGVTDAGAAVAEAFSHALDMHEGRVPPGIPTGYSALDALIGGIAPGQFVLFAGRPGMGKTVCLLDIARHAALRQGKNVLLVTLEMATREVSNRLLAAQSGVPLAKVRTGDLDPAEQAMVSSAIRAFASSGLVIDEQSTTVEQIAMTARKMRRRGGVDLIVVDYVQLVEGANPSGTERYIEVGAISRALKRLAKAVAPVVAGAQVNRASAARQDKRPTLADLRESGSLEQDADVVVILHREDYYNPGTHRDGEVDFIVAKHRNGPTGTLVLLSELDKARFVNPFA